MRLIVKENNRYVKPIPPALMCLAVAFSAMACKPSTPPAAETVADGLPPVSTRPAPTASERDDSTFADTTVSDSLKADTTAATVKQKAKAKPKPTPRKKRK